MVIDMTFIHQRTKAVALLWTISGSAGAGFLSVVPSMLPQVAWRQFYYYWSAPATVAFFLAFVLYPETYFKRPTVAFDGLILLQSATETLTVYRDDEADSDLYRDLPDLPSASPQSQFCKLCHYLRLTKSPIASWRSVGYCYLHMGCCAINPLIFWVVLTSAIHWTGILFIGATYMEVLQSPPYNLSLDSVQIVNINTSSAAGVLMAYPIGGWLIDRVLKRMAQRNHGVREAEHYLIGYIPPAVIGAVGAILYGFAVQYKLHFALYYLACALEGFSWITLCITNTMWLTEAFPRWAAPAVAVSAGACYILSFGIGFALVPWISAHGYKLVGVELAVLQIVAGLIAVPVAFWGRSARQAINGRWAGERSGALRPL